MQYFKLILSTVLIIIFNQINFVNCKLTFFSGGTGFKSLFTGDKLYFQNFITNFFYVDLTGVSLDSDTLVDQSKWIDLTDVKPQPDSLTSNNPILGGINNDKIMFFDISGENAIIDTFDTTSKQWVINQQVKTPISFFSDNNDWITDAKTGKAYSFDSTTTGMSIFDTVNLSLVKSLSTPKNLFTGTLVFYSDFVQVELPNGQILFIGGKLGSQSQSMKSLLTYDTIKDVWQMTNTAGTEPQGRTKHTAVSTSDGRVIVYGGVLNTVPALPQLAVLDTSIIPYTWSAPTEVNPIGSFSDHTAVMANNYMIFAFGKNESETKDSKSDNKDIYKLNVSDPLNYKWSLLASFDSTDTSTTPTPTNSSAPIQTDVSVGAGFFNNFGLKARWIVAILIILVALVCISIFVTYRVRRYRNKNKILNTTNQQKLSSSDELEKNLI